VERRRRRVKTDRIDLDKLMRVLLALRRGSAAKCKCRVSAMKMPSAVIASAVGCCGNASHA
jgi:hypothetical protein